MASVGHRTDSFNRPSGAAERPRSPYHEMHTKILGDTALTPDERLVLVVCTRFGRRGRNIHPGAEKLATLTGHHPEAVRRILKRLAAKGKLVLDVAPIRNRRATTWRLCDAHLPEPETVADAPNRGLAAEAARPNPGLDRGPRPTPPRVGPSRRSCTRRTLLQCRSAASSSWRGHEDEDHGDEAPAPGHRPALRRAPGHAPRRPARPQARLARLRPVRQRRARPHAQGRPRGRTGPPLPQQLPERRGHRGDASPDEGGGRARQARVGAGRPPHVQGRPRGRAGARPAPRRRMTASAQRTRRVDRDGPHRPTGARAGAGAPRPTCSSAGGSARSCGRSASRPGARPWRARTPARCGRPRG